MIDNFQTERHDFRKVYGAGTTLPDSRLKFLDTETKESANLFVDKMSTYIHRQANDPSMALYRVREHVRNKVPSIVEKDRILKRHEKKIEKVLYEVKYANISLQVNVKSNRKLKKINEMLNYLVFKTTGKKPKDKKNRADSDVENDEEDENSGELVTDDYIGGLVDEPDRKGLDDFDFVEKSFDDEEEEDSKINNGDDDDDFKPKDFSFSDTEGAGVDESTISSKSEITKNQQKTSSTNENQHHSVNNGGGGGRKGKSDFYISDSDESDFSSSSSDYNMEETMESYLPTDDIPKEVVIAEEEKFYVPTSFGESTKKKIDEESENIIDRFVDREMDGGLKKNTTKNKKTSSSSTSSTSSTTTTTTAKKKEQQILIRSRKKKKKRTMRRKKRRKSNTENAENILQTLTSQPIHLNRSDDDGIVVQSYNRKKKSARRKKRKKRRSQKKNTAVIEEPKKEETVSSSVDAPLPPQQQGNDNDDFKPANFDF